MASVTVRFDEDELELLLESVPPARLMGDAEDQIRASVNGLVAQETIRRTGLDGLTGVWTRARLVSGALLDRELGDTKPAAEVAIPGHPRGFGHPVAFRT